MAAYGLYTHIQSNKRRSVALLIGLFLLVYVMVFAGALLAEALTTHGYNGRYGGPPLDYLMRAAAFDFVKALPFATIGTVMEYCLSFMPVAKALSASSSAMRSVGMVMPREMQRFSRRL